MEGLTLQEHGLQGDHNGNGRRANVGELPRQVIEGEQEVGMEFESIKDAYKFYQKYVKARGFGVVNCGLRRGDDKEAKYQTFVCVHASTHKCRGNKNLKPRPNGRVE